MKILLATLLFAAPFLKAGDWTTYGHDPQRSGWASDEKTISAANASQLSLLWKTRLDNQFYSLTATTTPVIVTGVVTDKGPRTMAYVVGIGGTVVGLDANTGEQVWSYAFKTAVLPGKGRYQQTFLCPNGPTATPVIDKARNLVYALSADGALFGFDLATGKAKFGPAQFTAAYVKAMSLNLVDNTIYTTLAQGCGNALSGVYSMDVSDPHRVTVRQVLLSNTDTAGIWGAGGPVISKSGIVFGGTADGRFDTKLGDYSDSVVAVSAKDMKLVDYFTPENWDYIRRKDLDLGSASPVSFQWKNKEYVAGGFKEGVIYVMDAARPGGKDHQTVLYTTPRLGNDPQTGLAGWGIWGGISTARDDKGDTWIFAPVGGPLAAAIPTFPMTNGEVKHGSIMGFKVVANPNSAGNPMLSPQWISEDVNMPDPVAIANGVVFGLATGSNELQRGGDTKRMLSTYPAVLKGFDMKTGKKLFDSGDAMTAWVHFAGIAIADGKVFAVDHDSTVYCFGLKGK